MRRIALWSSITLFALTGCHDDELAAFRGKADAALRARVEAAWKSDPDEWLDVLGQCRAPVGEPERAALQRAGARLGAVVGEQFTAQAAVKDLGRIAKLEFVVQLQAARTAEPLRP